MSIKVQQSETPCNLIFSKREALEFYIFLIENQDSAIDPKLNSLVIELIADCHKSVLNTVKKQFIIEIYKEEALNLYGFLRLNSNLIENDENREVISKIIKDIQEYLLQE